MGRFDALTKLEEERKKKATGKSNSAVIEGEPSGLVPFTKPTSFNTIDGGTGTGTPSRTPYRTGYGTPYTQDKKGYTTKTAI
jgi:hypothetical protein